jgi:tetratricopeptide (TPR) repeat protein
MNQSVDDVLLPVKTLIRNRDLKGAAALLQELLVASPAGVELLELLGKVQFLQKQPQQARETFEKLTQIDPLHAPGWINLGALLNQLGEHKRAADALRRGLQRDRNNAEAYFNLGVAQKSLQMKSMAISAFKEAIRLKPAMIDAHLNLGAIYTEMNNHSLAQQSYGNALKQDPESRKAKALLEQSQQTQRENRRSQSPFGRLVDVDELSEQDELPQTRVLDIAERRAERELIQTVTKRIRQDAKGIPVILSETLQQNLHQLQVAVMHSEERIARPELHQKLVESMNSLRELRTSVAAGIAELRSHIQPSES